MGVYVVGSYAESQAFKVAIVDISSARVDFVVAPTLIGGDFSIVIRLEPLKGYKTNENHQEPCDCKEKKKEYSIQNP
jgi:hypothetical protein